MKVRAHIKSEKLAADGKLKIQWAMKEMPVLGLIYDRFVKEQPLKGIRIAACLHVTSETANLVRTLAAGGAKVHLCASNPLSTQDDVAASLVKHDKIPVFAIKGEDNKTYYRHIFSCLSIQPQITMDDGADLVTILHQKEKQKMQSVIGGTEETTTGVIRLKSMEEKGVLQYPIVAVNEALTKHLFDNRYGTGQSTLDGIIRATNVLLAGRTVVVVGYGFCGRGVAMRARGMGAKVVICEIDPLKALEAVMEGYQVMSLGEAAGIGDIFITVTGNIHVLRPEHFMKMRDGAILANSGHFNVEINIPGLKKMSVSKRVVRPFVEEFALKNKRKIYLLGDGRLINLTSAEGHPASVMDMSFANQALSAEFMVKNSSRLQKKVYDVPADIDRKVAVLKLRAIGIKIDSLTGEQKNYLSSWDMGT